jgi:hypothetical protein
MQEDEPKTLDLSGLLDRSHENKWVAFAPDYSEVVAASESLITLDKLVCEDRAHEGCSGRRSPIAFDDSSLRWLEIST